MALDRLERGLQRRQRRGCARGGRPGDGGAHVFLLSFPLSLIGKIFMAYREGKIANCWGAAGNVMSLIALLVVTQTQGELVWLLVAISGTGLALQALSGVWLFARHNAFLAPHPKAIPPSTIKELGHVGGMFFVIQITVVLIFQIDNLIIAHFAGAAAVTPYSVAYRLFGCTKLLQGLIFPNLWAAYAEAIAQGHRLGQANISLESGAEHALDGDARRAAGFHRHALNLCLDGRRRCCPALRPARVYSGLERHLRIDERGLMPP